MNELFLFNEPGGDGIHGELFVSAIKRWRHFEMKTSDDAKNNGFPLEKRLKAPNTRLIKAGIATIQYIETLRKCVAYENAHQNRT